MPVEKPRRSPRRPPPLPPGARAKRKRPPPLPARHRAASILLPDELERYRNLLLFARTRVEGYFAGKHRSPLRGSSAEFAEYKSYVPGDAVERIDWRVYARSRRLYIRERIEEKDMVLYLMVDTSASMAYAGTERGSKFTLAAKIAAALAYLVHRQGDKSSLVLFDDGIREFIPPGGTRRHLHKVVRTLEAVRPSNKTGIARAARDCASLFRLKGQIVLLSDLLDDPEQTMEALSRFVHRDFSVLLLQVLDPDELHLPPVGAARYVDMETQEEVRVDPVELRAAYQRRMSALQDFLADESNKRRVRHDLIDTTRPYHSALDAYLGMRGRE